MPRYFNFFTVTLPILAVDSRNIDYHHFGNHLRFWCPPFLSGFCHLCISQAVTIQAKYWSGGMMCLQICLNKTNKKQNQISFWRERKYVALVAPHRQLETHFSMNLSCLQQHRLKAIGPFETYWIAELTNLKVYLLWDFLFCELINCCVV